MMPLYSGVSHLACAGHGVHTAAAWGARLSRGESWLQPTRRDGWPVSRARARARARGSVSWRGAGRGVRPRPLRQTNASVVRHGTVSSRHLTSFVQSVISRRAHLSPPAPPPPPPHRRERHPKIRRNQRRKSRPHSQPPIQHTKDRTAHRHTATATLEQSRAGGRAHGRI